MTAAMMSIVAVLAVECKMNCAGGQEAMLVGRAWDRYNRSVEEPSPR
jgi:hypothetical protein